jgi:ribonuclease R
VSLTEQNSTEAERESTKLKLLEYFEREVARKKPNSFAAVIMDVRNHGMFVELVDSMAYGLVHVSTLRDDLYSLVGDPPRLVGRKSRVAYGVGQLIEVAVHRVDRFKRQIDFTVAATPKSAQKKR